MTDPDVGGVPGQLVGVIDPLTGDAELTGWVAGPAGVATVDLAGGSVRVAFDHAEAHLVASVRVDGAGDDPSTVAALDALLGGTWPAIRARLGERPRIVWAPDEYPGAPGGADTLALAGRFAVLLAEHRERPARGAAAALRALEIADLADDLPTGLGLDPSPDALWRAAATATRAVDPDQLAHAVPDHRRSVVAEWVTRAAAVDGDDGALAATVDALRRPGLSRSVAALALPPPAAAAAPGGRRPVPAAARPAEVTVAAGGARTGTPVPVELDPALGITLDRGVRTAGHVEVSVLGRVDGPLWLRVLRPPAGPLGAPLLVALARLRTTRFGPAWAAAMLPADLDDEPDAVLLVDVVADVTAAWHPAPVRATARGIRAGRDAVHAARTTGHRQARPAWERSAEAHEQAGDKRRAGLARAYADGDTGRGPRAWLGTDPRRGTPDPYLSDDAL